MSRSIRTLTGVLLTMIGSACAPGPSTPARGASVGSVAKGEDATRTQVALLVRLEAKPGKADELGRFLEGALPLVQQESGTMTWYAIRLGPTSFGIYDSFADETGRQAHLAGKVAAALFAKAPELLADAPKVEKVDVLASKLKMDGVHKGLVVRLEAKVGKEREVADFLRSGLAIVEEEPATKSWFAVQMGHAPSGSSTPSRTRPVAPRTFRDGSRPR
jgi:quinol monooxygenase YgiN